MTFFPYLYFTGPLDSFTTKVEPGVYSEMVPVPYVVVVVVVLVVSSTANAAAAETARILSIV